MTELGRHSRARNCFSQVSELGCSRSPMTYPQRIQEKIEGLIWLGVGNNTYNSQKIFQSVKRVPKVLGCFTELSKLSYVITYRLRVTMIQPLIREPFRMLSHYICMHRAQP